MKTTLIHLGEEATATLEAMLDPGYIYERTERLQAIEGLLTPSASDGMRAMMTMDNLKAHRKKNVAQSNLAEQIAHKIGGGTSQLSPLFVEEMMGYPLIYLVLPFLSQDGDRNQ